MLLAILNTLLSLLGGLGSDKDYSTDYGPNLKDGDEFDFIVVGAGSAGSVVANRLSEISHWKVLLLEAGGYPSGISEIPALAFLLQSSNEDWQHVMEPSETCCLGVQNNRCNCPGGKGLGGSTLINAMIYARSTRHDHDRWVNQGNIGWDYDSIVKYYNKIENYTTSDSSYFGNKGNLHLTRPISSHPIRDILKNAYEQLGFDEYTEDKPIGYKDNILSVRDGIRESVARAYLAPIKNRKNLYLAVNAQVGKLLIDRNELSVNGVEVKINDKIIILKANKEVVLSAGSINSPKILMSSGIGPKEHLAKLGLLVLKDLKVGENYHDHIGYPPFFVELAKSAITSTTPLQMMKELHQFFMYRQGRLTKLDDINFNSYLNTQNETEFSNVAFVHIPIEENDGYALQQLARCTTMPKGIEEQLITRNNEYPLLQIFPILLQPKSRGFIRLRSADPYSNPLIIPNFFNDEHGEDLKSLLHAIKLAKKLIGTKSFSAHSPNIIDLKIANCPDFPLQSDEFLKCAIRNLAISVFHPVGTCKMGPIGDGSAVVDSQLRIHGIKGARIIDGSIIPIVPSCNTNAPILMIGEKGADMIKNDWLIKHVEL